jgi:hypothetical protein
MLLLLLLCAARSHGAAMVSGVQGAARFTNPTVCSASGSFQGTAFSAELC